jgi:histone deacetylase 6
VIFPIAKEFAPELIIVSAGFDAMLKDPLGKMSVTAAGFAYMLSNLRSLAGGKVVVVLEGGYSLNNLEEAGETVVKVLLEKDFPQLGATAEPTREGLESIRATHATASEFFRLEEQ